MKPCLLFSLMSLACLAQQPGTKPPDPFASVRAAAITFYTELRSEEIRGLPSEPQLKRLAPLLTPELNSLIVRARAEQQRQIKEYPDEKPNWIEGDLFGSMFEGVKQWELGSAFSAPEVDATVKVNLTYTEPNQKPVNWTDTLVFKERKKKWLLDDIRMGGDWAFKSGDSLRSRLPGGGKEGDDHGSPDERWKVSFQRDGDAVTKITIQSTDKAAKSQILFGNDKDEPCPFPTYAVWSPDCDMLAVRLGDGPRFTRTLIYRLIGKIWQPVKMPEFYPEEKKTMAANGFRERDSLIDAEHWQDANTLVVKYFGNFTKGDEGDGYSKFISVHINARGKASVVEAVDTPGDD